MLGLASTVLGYVGGIRTFDSIRGKGSNRHAQQCVARRENAATPFGLDDVWGYVSNVIWHLWNVGVVFMDRNATFTVVFVDGNFSVCRLKRNLMKQILNIERRVKLKLNTNFHKEVAIFAPQD